MKKVVFITLLLTTATHLFSQNSAIDKGLQAITPEVVAAQMDFLASDLTEGRETGLKGEFIAASYISSVFKIYGLEPGGFAEEDYPRTERNRTSPPDQVKSYFQVFPLMKSEASDKQEFAIETETDERKTLHSYTFDTDFFFYQRPSVSMKTELPVVFAGYGLSDDEKGYDDYKGLDVKGKAVLILYGFPGHLDTTTTAWEKFHPTGSRWAAYQAESNKIETARKKGAAAVIFAYTIYSPSLMGATNEFRYTLRGGLESDEPIPNFYDYGLSLVPDSVSTEIPAYRITKRMLNDLTDGSGIDAEKFENVVMKDMKPAGKNLKNKKIKLETRVTNSIIRARNVIGVIEGKRSDEIVVVGAHYDHLGKYNGYVWNGADDNASGTVAVMTLAKACMATGEKPERTIVFATWTGEEKGLLGSKYFTEHPYRKKIFAYVNFDMIGRNGQNDSAGTECRLVYTKAYPSIEENNKKFNEEKALGLEMSYRPQEKPRGGSDHTPFAEKNIPILYYLAGYNEEYHTPADELDKINYEKMARIIRLSFTDVWTLANCEGL
ncbi:MAG: M20/M25/M40 family metallo-hydrolase [Bacteroidota bacterium]